MPSASKVTRGVASCVAVALLLAAPGFARDSPVPRVGMLQVGTRTTIVFELAEPIHYLHEVPSGSGLVVFEAGPIMTKLKSQELTPAATDAAASLVTSVRVQEVIGTDGMTYLRLQVKLNGGASH